MRQAWMSGYKISMFPGQDELRHPANLDLFWVLAWKLGWRGITKHQARLEKNRTKCAQYSCAHFSHIDNPSPIRSGISPLSQDRQNFTLNNASSSSPDFPRQIWQTARTNLPSLDPSTQTSIKSWMDQNADHLYTLITAERGHSYVEEHFAHRPDLVADFLAIQDPMLRADLVQYLFLLTDGGIYTDLDTICLKPISDRIPPSFNKADMNLILGIEGDALGGPLIPGFSHPVQFATWTMAVKPGHFMIEMIISRVISQLHALAESQGTTISGIEAGYMDVMDTTGPGVFAESVYAGLSQITDSSVTSVNLTSMTEPRLFGDVLVLPITSFGAGLLHSNARGVDDERALVQHLFAGTWKGDHLLGGENQAGEEEKKKTEVVNDVSEVDLIGKVENGELPQLEVASGEGTGELPELTEANADAVGEELQELRVSRGRQRRRHWS